MKAPLITVADYGQIGVDRNSRINKRKCGEISRATVISEIRSNASVTSHEWEAYKVLRSTVKSRSFNGHDRLARKGTVNGHPPMYIGGVTVTVTVPQGSQV
jgi:hypothetical protein